jgi:hypothetical protein
MLRAVWDFPFKNCSTNGEKQHFQGLPLGLPIYCIMKRNLSQAVLRGVFQLFSLFFIFFLVLSTKPHFS